MGELQDQILAADDLKPEPISVPGWPDGLYVRVLPVEGLDVIQSIQSGKTDSDQISVAECARIVGIGLCDANGEPIFDEAGIERLRKTKPLAVLDPIVTRILEKNGLTDSEDRAGN